jgi:hypothetical protein
MRFYIYRPGTPGYISAEVAVRELPTDDSAHLQAWAEDTWSPSWLGDAHRFISRTEALMVPLYRDALERWERPRRRHPSRHGNDGDPRIATPERRRTGRARVPRSCLGAGRRGPRADLLRAHGALPRRAMRRSRLPRMSPRQGT